MIKRNNIAHGANANTMRTRSGADCIQTWRRHPALVGAEVMLDAEREVEAELIAQFKPEFFIAQVGCHSRLTPNVRKMRKLHSEASFGGSFTLLGCAHMSK